MGLAKTCQSLVGGPVGELIQPKLETNACNWHGGNASLETLATIIVGKWDSLVKLEGIPLNLPWYAPTPKDQGDVITGIKHWWFQH